MFLLEGVYSFAHKMAVIVSIVELMVVQVVHEF